MPSTRHAVALVLVVLAGCAGAPTAETPANATDTSSLALDGADIAATDATVCPGRAATVSVIARNASTVHLAGWTDADALAVDWENTTATPPFDIVYQSLPPAYAWNTPQPRVEMTFVVTAPANATPGTYRSSASVRHGDAARENRSTTPVVVTVARNADCT